MSEDTYNLEAVQRGVKLMERASVSIQNRRYTDRVGNNWSPGRGSDYPWHNGVHGTARLSYSADGRRYEVSVYTYDDGLRVFRKEYATLDAALRRGTLAAASEPDPDVYAESWNLKYPVGTPVRYWTGVREGEGTAGETRSAAKVLCGQAAVWVTGHCAYVKLSHVRPVRLATTKEARDET